MGKWQYLTEGRFPPVGERVLAGSHGGDGPEVVVFHGNNPLKHLEWRTDFGEAIYAPDFWQSLPDMPEEP